MITVGSVYMSVPDAPVKEIMKDMLEMSRGVQHPTRGLFLRHYLSGQTRDFLPVGNSDGYVKQYPPNILTVMQSWRQSSGFYWFCSHKLYRDEQALGATSTPRSFS